ncbi:MAG TPA: phosphoglucosamine mutase [Candidatus Latescibacteria bacterium]|nr:phosphoglucosamine mutase [Candidatus Latescibacterota bacterium]
MGELIISISGVRGIVGEMLTPETALGMTAAFAEVAPEGEILVASDGRTSGDSLRAACLAALSAKGRTAVDLGVATTPTTEMAVILRKAAGAIIVTASHNPVEWNGLKFLDQEGVFLRQGQLDRLVSIWKRSVPEWKRWEFVQPVLNWDGAADAHVERILALDVVNAEACRQARLPVVLDTICASGGRIAPKLLRALGSPFVHVNAEITGKFTRKPEPVPENIRDVGEAVRANHAALGMVLDPDGDRLALLDETGEPIGEEYTLALSIYAVRRRARTRAPVVVNASTSRMVDDVGAMFGFPVLRTAVGEINVVEGMVKHGADLGGEGNGGVIYGGLHYGRDGLLGMAIILSLLAEEKCRLSDLVRKLPRYVISKQTATVPPEKRAAVLHRVRSLAAEMGAELDTCDGVKLVWADRWLHVRPSNTEPIIRIFAEAPTEQDARELCARAQEIAARE